MMDVGSWLRGLGLERYEAAFRENEIDETVLPTLTADDLKDLGVSIVGHRRRLLNAIEALCADANTKVPFPDTLSTIVRSPKDAAERRHLTVMICDLVGSTALSARLDPEDMRVEIDAYHAACARITRTYDGFLAEFRGDGILAYFGYPIAHEDDAERTVRAGLDIIAAVARLETRAAEPLAVRIGIATGVVVIGDLRREGALREHAVVGTRRTLQPAFRPWPSPGRLSSPPPRAGCSAIFFICVTSAGTRSRGCRAGRGVGGRGRVGSESRFEAVPLTSLTDPDGREDEIDLLLGRQRLAWKGEGQIVLISGEPGIGKSRLAAALGKRIAGEPHTRLSYHARPTTPTARFVRSSRSWSERRGSRQTIRPSSALTSWKRSSLWAHRGFKS